MHSRKNLERARARKRGRLDDQDRPDQGLPPEIKRAPICPITMKRSHLTKHDALDHIAGLRKAEKENGPGLHTWQCRFCGCWHVGHGTPRPTLTDLLPAGFEED